MGKEEITFLVIIFVLAGIFSGYLYIHAKKVRVQQVETPGITPDLHSNPQSRAKKARNKKIVTSGKSQHSSDTIYRDTFEVKKSKSVQEIYSSTQFLSEDIIKNLEYGVKHFPHFKNTQELIRYYDVWDPCKPCKSMDVVPCLTEMLSNRNWITSYGLRTIGWILINSPNHLNSKRYKDIIRRIKLLKQKIDRITSKLKIYITVKNITDNRIIVNRNYELPREASLTFSIPYHWSPEANATDVEIEYKGETYGLNLCCVSSRDSDTLLIFEKTSFHIYLSPSNNHVLIRAGEKR